MPEAVSPQSPLGVLDRLVLVVVSLVLHVVVASPLLLLRARDGVDRSRRERQRVRVDVSESPVEDARPFHETPCHEHAARVDRAGRVSE